MTDTPGTPNDSLSVSALLEIDKICRQFEAELEAGNEPDLEAFLGDTREPRRSQLRSELEAVLREHHQESERQATLDQFVENLLTSGLLSKDQLQTVLHDLPAGEQPQTADDLAKLLHRQGRLTRFQAQAVYRGQTRGLVLGNYVVLDKLGRGGMGQVFKAEHRLMERRVALKMLSDEALRSPQAMKRFHREVQAAARLSHPNIVAAHDADEADGIHFLVMEYVAGRDLASLVRDQGPLPVTDAVDYILQAAAGLDYAHRQGVVHRDIKPANILLDEEGVVKILDMGLARVENTTDEDKPLTHTGQVMGTVDFMSPEQTLDTRHVDGRTDIYSLGCTLYYLLAGRPPFGGESMTEKMLAHREEPIPSLRAANPDVSEALDEAFQKMLAKEPDRRQASMAEVIADLEACRASLMRQTAESGPFTKGPTGDDETFTRLASRAPSQRQPRGDADREMRFYGTIAVGVSFLIVLIVMIAVKTPRCTIVVRVNEPDAQVSVLGGRLTRRTPGDPESVEMDVSEGRHTLKVTKAGFATHTQTFTIKRGARETFDVALVPLAERVEAATVQTTVQPDSVARQDDEQHAEQTGHLLANGWRIAEPVNLGPAVNSGDNDHSPHLSYNGLTLLFTSNRAGGFGRDDLWMSRRASTSEPFGEPINLGSPVSSDAIDRNPCLSADELTLLFSSNRAGGQGNMDLWMCQRTAPSEPFAAAVNLGPTVNSAAMDASPCLSADGLTLIFHSTRVHPDGTRNEDLWSCRRTSTSEPFGEPSNLGEPVNSRAMESNPALSADGLTLVFRTRGPGYGPDLLMATRRSVSELFDVPFDLGPTINTEAYEGCPALSSDSTLLLFDSDRPGGVGRRDLWMARIERSDQATASTPGE